MAKFIRMDEWNGSRYLNLEFISYVDVEKKSVWTIEPKKDGQCKYIFEDREEIWQEILDFLHANEYKRDGGL